MFHIVFLIPIIMVIHAVAGGNGLRIVGTVFMGLFMVSIIVMVPPLIPFILLMYAINK